MQLQQWRKTDPSAKGKAIKPKYVYKTAEELRQSGKRVSSRGQKGHTSVKVIDMTGRQRRVLSSYEEIHDRHSRPDESFTRSASSGVYMYMYV